MLLKILRFIFGYVRVEIRGFAPERFMNLIMKQDIVLWDVENTKEGYRFYTGGRNLMKMKPFLQKTNMKLSILERYGLPFMVKKYKRRTAFLAGFFVFCILVYILSLFVWEVRVTGEDKLVADTLLKEIEKNYVPLGTKKSLVDCTRLEEQLRKEFEEISWVSCELKGTRLTVYLEEGMQPQKKDKETAPGDLVAVKDGILTKMITRQGTPMVQVKNTVKKGDILISGTIYIYDDNNEVLETSYVTADGDVFGQTTQQYKDSLELEYYEKKYSEKAQKHITFFVLDYCFTPWIPDSKNKQYDTYTQIHKAKILNDFYLPFGYKWVEQTPYTLERKRYSEKEGKEILMKRWNKNLKRIQEKGVQIIENNVTIDTMDGKMVASGTLVLEEPIAVLKPITGNISEDASE